MEADVSTGQLLLAGMIVMVGLVAWAVRAEARSRSNTHRLDALERNVREDRHDWHDEMQTIESKLDSLTKVSYLMAGKMGVELPREG